VRFYERREVRDMIAYLRVLANPEDTVSLRRVLNVPKRGIGDRAEAVVATHSERERVSFAQALRDAAEDKVPLLNPRSVKAIGGFVAMLDELGTLIENGAEVHDVLEAVMEKTGYRVELEESEDPQDATRVENLTELVTVAREFTEITAEIVADENAELVVDEGVPAPGSLPAFLERVSLVADADSVPSPDGGEEGDGGAGVVTLMTVHTAKGLEYPVVFCTGWEDGVFPHMRALGDPTELAEERRLAYVAITRARKRLYVSRAITRSAWGQPSMNPASRFLDELPPDLVDWRRLEPSNRGFGSFGSGSRGTPRAATTWGNRSSSAPSPGVSSFGKGWKDTVALKLDVGDRVSHDKYGLGTVVSCDGVGPRATATIDFGAAGKVRLMLIGSVPMVKL
jgi:DNA helicase-2/ATP-dependent DNA helicase PcrA